MTLIQIALAAGALALACTATAHASAAPRKRQASVPDIERDLATLAQQRPWQCKAPASWSGPAAAALVQTDLCAWQNRLRMRRWNSAPAQPNACVSDAARFWSWARTLPGASAAQPIAWRGHWNAYSMQGGNAEEQFVVIIKRMPEGHWSATEWRWRPSTRLATRRWQAARWDLLAARAAQLRPALQADGGPREAGMLRAVLEGNLGSRPGDTAGDVWRWPADGLCLRADLPGIGPQQLQLPYAVDDSRLEQRAAMQLHLARRLPKATWLTTFRLMPAQGRGGAKFYAIWSEDGLLKGQLWIPTKGDGALVRVRIDTALAPARAGQPEASARAGAVIERELAALAARWARAYE